MKTVTDEKETKRIETKGTLEIKYQKAAADEIIKVKKDVELNEKLNEIEQRQ